MTTLPRPLPEPKRDLPWIFTIRTSWIPGGKTMKVWLHPLSLQRIPHTHPSPQSLLNITLPLSRSYQFITHGHSAPRRQILDVTFCTCLSPNLERWYILCSLNSLMSTKKVIAFQLVQVYLVVKPGLTISKFFAY